MSQTIALVFSESDSLSHSYKRNRQILNGLPNRINRQFQSTKRLSTPTIKFRLKLCRYKSVQVRESENSIILQLKGHASFQTSAIEYAKKFCFVRTRFILSICFSFHSLAPSARLRQRRLFFRLCKFLFRQRRSIKHPVPMKRR